MLTTDQKAGQLYKHFLNVSDTRDNRDFYEEAIQSSFCIRPEQLLMYGDEIPRGDSQEAINAIRNLKNGEYFDYQKDETTVIHIVQYHEKYSLTKIDNGTDNAFKLVDSDGNPIQNIIPFNYYKDVYNYDLTTADGKKIYFGVGDWVLDTFSGVLKFYGDVPDGVDHENPPKISFYQYVGGTGFRQDTFGYEGAIIPVTGWHISKDTYLIDNTNEKTDGSFITLEDQISQSSNAIQDNFAAVFGFDGDDKNEGIAYTLQKIISLTYTSSLDNVKGYDRSSSSDIGTLLTRKKVSTSVDGLNFTFCSHNVPLNEQHKITILGNTIAFDNGASKQTSGPTKLSDNFGNFIVVEQTSDHLADGEYPIEIVEDVTKGILLYWDREERDYLPFINNEDDYYNFGFPIVTANGRIPPSVSIGAITLNDYKDSITPEYYGPRNYTVTIATGDGDKVKSADYIVKNIPGAYLDDIFQRIMADYTDADGNFTFIGSVFIRAGEYKLSKDTLDLSLFKKLNIIGEDKHQTIIESGISVVGAGSGTITLSNVTLNGDVAFNSDEKSFYFNEILGKNVSFNKYDNSLYIKNCSFDDIKITSSQEPQHTDDNKTYNSVVGSIIGSFESNTGHTFLNGNNIGTLKLFDVEKDAVKACFIQTVVSKPRQTDLVGSTVFNYVDTPFTEIPHMRHFPIYSKDSDLCLEYATFDSPFVINYKQDGNTINIALDSEYLFINEEGELSCNLNAASIIVDVSQLTRNGSYEGDLPGDAIPNKSLQEALNDIYSTKADLNPDGKIPLDELPDSVAYGGLLFVGTWSFEYEDRENASAEDNYFVDGRSYPTYNDATTRLTLDKDQDGKLQPGWFWIVESSRKDDDKPAQIQKAQAQNVQDAEGNVVYSDNGISFTAGDWVIWNGTYFEKLDRAYQDAAYSVLPIYTTGEHLCWSWRDNEDDKKWGLGALSFGGETIAEGFDKINQELRKLWVKHPGILSNISLVPFEEEQPYKTLKYFPISNGALVATPLEAYDSHRDERVKGFRVKTPVTDPKWKSSIFVGDSCQFVATVDGESTLVNYTPTNTDVTVENVHISPAFDPYVEEISGSNYWKAVYVDFGGENLNEGEHKFLLSMDRISPKNEFTKDAISRTAVFAINVVDKHEYVEGGQNAAIDENITTVINADEIKTGEAMGYCSGVPNVVAPVTLRFSFTVKNVLDAVNTNLKILQFVDNLNGKIVDIPTSYMKFSLNSETNLYNITVSNFPYEFPMEKISSSQSFSLIAYDVYNNSCRIDDFMTLDIRISPGLKEKERVLSGKNLYPSVDLNKSQSCGGAYLSEKNLKESEPYKLELMKCSRYDLDGSIVHDYGWPDGKNSHYGNNVVDYENVVDGDNINIDGFDGTYRWVTFSGFMNNGVYEPVVLNENSGFTMVIDVAEDIKPLLKYDVYNMSTNADDIIIMSKIIDPDKSGDKSVTQWFNCNSPYDGFAEVGTDNGQPAMYAGSSSLLSKRITFGRSTYTGNLITRVGIKKDSGIRIKSITIKDLI